jgi:hypothetical protein
MTTDDRLVWALADYLAAQTYLTHADRDTIGRAFTAGWNARAGATGTTDTGGAHRLEEDDQ